MGKKQYEPEPVRMHQNAQMQQSQRRSKMEDEPQHGMNMGSRNFQLIQHPKVMMEAGKIQPYMKEFKMEATKQLMPIYSGYHKKSSKPVVIKYCP